MVLYSHHNLSTYFSDTISFILFLISSSHFHSTSTPTTSTKMPSNTAAWVKRKNQPLEIRPSDYVSPREDEIVIKTKATAINPVDVEIQKHGSEMFPWMKFPHICGSDVAGEVVEIGASVVHCKVGDRVMGLTLSMTEGPANGGFQTYTLLKKVVVSPIPDSMPYEKACTLPLGVSTAACALYQDDYLALEPPSLSPKTTGKCVLVWGGSSSPGCNAIQLAAASGHHVLTTASPKSFDKIRKLGDCEVFDYKSETVVRDIINALQGKTFAGALAIIPGAEKACYDIAAHAEGNKIVVIFNESNVEPPKEVKSRFVFGASLVQNEVGPMIWRDFLPTALKQGKYTIPLEPEIVGKGLEFVQRGYEMQSKGVSGKKLVVSL